MKYTFTYLPTYLSLLAFCWYSMKYVRTSREENCGGLRLKKYSEDCLLFWSMGGCSYCAAWSKNSREYGTLPALIHTDWSNSCKIISAILRFILLKYSSKCFPQSELLKLGYFVRRNKMAFLERFHNAQGSSSFLQFVHICMSIGCLILVLGKLLLSIGRRPRI